MPAPLRVASHLLRTRLRSYLRRHGWAPRRGRNGKTHLVSSHSTHLRRLVEQRFGARAAMSQQAISNFLTGRSHTIRLDHANMLAGAVGMRLVLPRQVRS